MLPLHYRRSYDVSDIVKFAMSRLLGEGWVGRRATFQNQDDGPMLHDGRGVQRLVLQDSLR